MVPGNHFGSQSKMFYFMLHINFMSFRKTDNKQFKHMSLYILFSFRMKPNGRFKIKNVIK